MPTGYTAGVQDGTITEFKDFAIQCARAFGANIMMRDDPLNSPIVVQEVAGYHYEWLDEAKAELSRLRKLSIEECEAEAKGEWKKAVAYREETLVNDGIHMSRYDMMLEKVRVWNPPTPDHVHMKEWMIKQLEESIKFDCGHAEYYSEKPILEDAKEWRKRKIEEAEKKVQRRAKDLEEEIARTRERNEWNRKLFESLGETLPANKAS